MSSKIITYDLRTPGKDYESLYTKIKQYNSWAKITESCWYIKTNDSCVDVWKTLNTAMDKNDRLFVAALSSEAAWSNVICDGEKLKHCLETL